MTTDRRQNKLSVKVNLIDMHPSLLVDFRLSKVNKFDIVELRKMNTMRTVSKICKNFGSTWQMVRGWYTILSANLNSCLLQLMLGSNVTVLQHSVANSGHFFPLRVMV